MCFGAGAGVFLFPTVFLAAPFLLNLSDSGSQPKASSENQPISMQV